QPLVALQFFRRAEKQHGFHLSESAFVSILNILAENDITSSAYWVMEKAIDAKIDGVLLDVFITGATGSSGIGV
ncbi:pentatricopeptide repeat-containing protein, partial [Trifolium medium]|nr:pentatricopeptide repeat-containing protein [Trifolium medium]